MSQAADSPRKEYCFDTETTGLSPERGDRVVEIACVELLDLIPTGRTWHTYVDPERDVPAEAARVHGLTRDFLRGKPKFKDIARGFLDFVGDGRLVAHNAHFDIRFINAELERLRLPKLSNPYTDTVAMAKKRYPGAKASLDDLCRRFGIDLSGRVKHEAMLDTQLLARVYLELSGGRHRALDFSDEAATSASAQRAAAYPGRPVRALRPHLGIPSQSEFAAHAAFLEKLKSPFWSPPRAHAIAGPTSPGL